jgi:allene oxide cyclase
MTRRGLAAVLLFACGCTAAIADPTLHVVERPTTDTVIHVNSGADSIGDRLVFANPLFDATNTQRVGTAQGSCVSVVAGKTWECLFQLVIGNDWLVFEGSFADTTGDIQFAILGGAGKYVGAKGLMKARVRDPKLLPNGSVSAYDMIIEIR